MQYLVTVLPILQLGGVFEFVSGCKKLPKNRPVQIGDSPLKYWGRRVTFNKARTLFLLIKNLEWRLACKNLNSLDSKTAERCATI